VAVAKKILADLRDFAFSGSRQSNDLMQTGLPIAWSLGAV